MAENKNGNLTVRAKVASDGDSLSGKIIIETKNFHKVIPAVLFTPDEAQTLLEIIDKIESCQVASY